MKLSVTRVLVAISPLLLVCAVCGQASQNGASSEYGKLIQMHKPELARDYDMTMTNLVTELKGLAQQYPVLSGIGSAFIHKNGSPDSCNNWLAYSTNGAPPYLLRIFTVGPGGGKTSGRLYPLIAEGGDPKFYLSYDLQLSPPDPALEKAVRDIMERQVGKLRRSFRAILGIDPVEERLQICGEAMTNILRGLQVLAPQFPAWKDIGSATIDQDGAHHVYSHLRYWKNVARNTTTTAPLNQAQGLGDNPVVEKGGVALDVYILNAKEPLAFVPNQRQSVFFNPYTAESDIDLVYRLRFNPGDPISNSARTVYGVTYGQLGRLTDALRHFIDFEGLKSPRTPR
jgi:hypothetical protein